MRNERDHGGGLDAAAAHYGGTRADWLDLSTGINPVPYPVGDIGPEAWTALPDQGAMDRLLAAARTFWNVPDGAQIIAANGASALIAQIPYLGDGCGAVYIPKPTYNEHEAAFASSGAWSVWDNDSNDAAVFVHPNNPDGRLWPTSVMGGSRELTIIDESFCDVTPQHSHIALSEDQGILVLKSFGKFWGLAGLRLGFAIAQPALLFPRSTYKGQDLGPEASLIDRLGPWAVSGPALEIGAKALEDIAWAEATRRRLRADAARLDDLVGWPLVGGTDLFRTYQVEDAAAMQDKLAQGKVWSRVFPYSTTWIRLGLPAPDRWDQLEAALR